MRKKQRILIVIHRKCQGKFSACIAISLQSIRMQIDRCNRYGDLLYFIGGITCQTAVHGQQNVSEQLFSYNIQKQFPPEVCFQHGGIKIKGKEGHAASVMRHDPDHRCCNKLILCIKSL